MTQFDKFVWLSLISQLTSFEIADDISQDVIALHMSIIMTSSNGNIFRVTGPLCGEFTGHRRIPLTKASDAELWCLFSLICAWVNNREAGDLRRHCAHYDVTIMNIWNDIYISGTIQHWTSHAYRLLGPRLPRTIPNWCRLAVSGALCHMSLQWRHIDGLVQDYRIPSVLAMGYCSLALSHRHVIAVMSQGNPPVTGWFT